MASEMVERIALAAWKEYCGVPSEREEWMSDADWEDEQAPVRQWYEWPQGCTHIGADGFRACAIAVLKELSEPTEAMRKAYWSGDWGLEQIPCFDDVWSAMIRAAMEGSE